MNDFVLPEKVAFDTVGTTDISTVKLNSVGQGYETCLFYANGDNNVVAVYDTLEDALASHGRIVDQEQKHLEAST